MLQREEDLAGMEEDLEEQMVLEQVHRVDAVGGRSCASHGGGLFRDSPDGCVHGRTPRRKVRRPATQHVFHNLPPTSLLIYG
jgi:hypothetical protein